MKQRVSIFRFAVMLALLCIVATPSAFARKEKTEKVSKREKSERVEKVAEAPTTSAATADLAVKPTPAAQPTVQSVAQPAQIADSAPALKASKKSKKVEEKKNVQVTTEFGLGIGARYNWFKVQPVSELFTPNMKMRLSYGAALQFRLNIGKSFGIQPEISYAYSTLRISDPTNNFNTKAKSNVVQIPMLLSFRIAMFRINFGPVFTLMDSTSYQLADKDQTIKQMTLGKLYPAITYAAGISVKLSRRLMIDVRYADAFRFVAPKNENAYVWTLDSAKQPEAQRFTTMCRSVQLRFGVIF